MLVGIEIVEKKVVVFNTIFQMIDDFLFLVYFDSKASFVVKDVFFIINGDFA